MSSRYATVLVIFIVAVIAFCLASVFGAMTGQISIFPNETESGGVLDNLSVLTDDSQGYNYDSYGSQDTSSYSSSDSSSEDSSSSDDTSDDSSSKSNIESYHEDTSSTPQDTQKQDSSSSSSSQEAPSGSSDVIEYHSDSSSSSNE